MTQIPQHLAFTIRYDGAVRELCTSIKIGLPSLTADFDPNKNFADFARAIWDTGAAGTVINKRVVDALGLQPTGMQKVIGVNNESIKATHMVDLILPNNVVVQNVNVVEGSGSFDVLIGMDIIQMGDFFISRAQGRTMFSFCIPPHETPTDLVEKSNAINRAIAKRMRKATKFAKSASP